MTGNIININIEVIDEIEDKEWDELITHSQDSSIFHTKEWANIIQKTNMKISTKYIVARDKNGNLLGGLQIFDNSLPGGFHLLETPYLGNPLISKGTQIDINNQILKKLFQISKKSKVVKVLIGDYSNTCSYLNQLKFKKKEFFTYLVELENSYDKIRKEKFNRNCRRNISKAEKNNIKIRKVENLKDVELYHKISKETHLRLSGFEVYSLNYFKNIYETMNNKEMFIWNLAEINGRIIAGSLIFLHKNSLFNFLTINYSDCKKYEPNFLLISNDIKWAIENEYKYYNLGGNPEDAEGLNRFKESWGAERKIYNLYYIEKLPWKIANKYLDFKK
jgi:lipid II:glycine glycyltransferase (peptidoglycan interpeptide bridge formation enzyme)